MTCLSLILSATYGENKKIIRSVTLNYMWRMMIIEYNLIRIGTKYSRISRDIVGFRRHEPDNNTCAFKGVSPSRVSAPYSRLLFFSVSIRKETRIDVRILS